MKTTATTLLLMFMAGAGMNAHGQQFSWAKNCSDSANVTISKVAVDKGGNTYATGFFTGMVTMGATTLTAASQSDYFLAKYDSVGHILWAKSGGGTGGDQGNDVCVDSLGNILVTGIFHSSISFDTAMLSNTDTDFASENLFIVKYNAAGNVMWARQSLGNCEAGMSSIYANSSGVYVAGQFGTHLKLESTTLTATTSQGFVASYDAMGNLRWAGQLTGAGSSGAYSVVADKAGNVYTTGFIEGAVSVGSISLASHGLLDAYVAKYDGAGTPAWAIRAGGSGTAVNEGQALSTDGTHIYLTGYFQGATADVGTASLTGNGGPCSFIARLDAGGNVLWATAPSGSADMVSHGYALTADGGHLYATGEFMGSVTFGSLPAMTSVGGLHGSYDVFVVKYDTSGNALWSTSAGGAGDDAGTSISKYGHIISLSGGYSGTAYFGADTLTNSTSSSKSFLAGMRDTTSAMAVHTIASPIPGFTIYPNPVSSVLHVSCERAGGFQYELYSVAGYKMASGRGEHDIDMSRTPSCTYLLRLTDADGNASVQIVVKE